LPALSFEYSVIRQPGHLSCLCCFCCFNVTSSSC